VRPLLIASLIASLAACGGDDSAEADGGDVALGCEFESRVEAFELGMTAAGTDDYLATLREAQPFPVARNDNRWTISVTQAGSPASGLAVDVNPRMPDHGHGTSIKAIATGVSGVPGDYELNPINLWMPGYWEINLSLSDGESSVDQMTFRVCIDP